MSDDLNERFEKTFPTNNWTNEDRKILNYDSDNWNSRQKRETRIWNPVLIGSLIYAPVVGYDLIESNIFFHIVVSVIFIISCIKLSDLRNFNPYKNYHTSPKYLRSIGNYEEANYQAEKSLGIDEVLPIEKK